MGEDIRVHTLGLKEQKAAKTFGFCVLIVGLLKCKFEGKHDTKHHCKYI